MSTQILIFRWIGQIGKSIYDIFPNGIKFSKAESDFNSSQKISIS